MLLLIQRNVQDIKGKLVIFLQMCLFTEIYIIFLLILYEFYGLHLVFFAYCFEICSVLSTKCRLLIEGFSLSRSNQFMRLTSLGFRSLDLHIV